MARKSFANEFFFGKVSGVAALFLWAGLVVGWVALDLPVTKWWEAYLQSLSTAFVGVAATVWLVNYFIEAELRKAAREMRESMRDGAATSLRRLVPRLMSSLP